MAVSFGPKAGLHAGTRTICAIFLFPFFVPSSTYPWHLPHTGKEVEFLGDAKGKSNKEEKKDKEE